MRNRRGSNMVRITIPCLEGFPDQGCLQWHKRSSITVLPVSLKVIRSHRRGRGGSAWSTARWPNPRFQAARLGRARPATENSASWATWSMNLMAAGSWGRAQHIPAWLRAPRNLREVVLKSGGMSRRRRTIRNICRQQSARRITGIRRGRNLSRRGARNFHRWWGQNRRTTRQRRSQRRSRRRA